MKRIFVTMLALSLTAGVFAQSETAERKIEKKEWKQKDRGDRKDVMKDLNLTETQRTQIKALNQDYRSKMQSLKADKSLSEEQLKQQRLHLTRQHRSNIENLLTNDQKKIWKEKQFEFKEDRKDGGAKKRSFKNKQRQHGKVDAITSNLNLSTEQQKQLISIEKKFKDDADQVRSNASFTPEEKKERLNNLRKDHKQSIENLLTSDQRQQLKENKKNHRHHTNDKTVK